MKTCDIESVYQKKAAESTEYIHKPALATRNNEGKRRWSLLDIEAIEGLVDVLEFGAEKYGDFNWQKGQKYSTLFDSAMRHIASIQKGEALDTESELPHIYHAMANLMMLSWMMKHKPEMNDFNP